MADLAPRLALKERLPRAWPAFFERHGSFTAVQEAAMPVLLDGHDALVVAATAGGKTEAVLAPLVERHCARGAVAPVVLYLVPTRALASDLVARLRHPLETVGLRLGIRTGDRGKLRAERPPDILITTPESLDSLLSSQARTFAALRAVVLDELHLLDGTPRGDHLRVLLNRLRRIRAYAHAHRDAPDAAVQVVGLSATVAHPAALAARYCGAGARVVAVAGGRALEAERIAMPSEGASALRDYLRNFRARGWRKALAFCNSRADVESYAAAVREGSPFGDAVYVHYSNIEAARRRETEERFATDSAAILFATSTLELGVDIGDIDVVLLIGPPGGAASFSQRVGRGNRRRGVTRVACFHRTPLEGALFDALLADVAPRREAAAEPFGNEGDTPFRPSVAVQQIFSLIKANPSGAVRASELDALLADLLPPQDIDAILDELHRRRYLAPGRPGDWTAGPRLGELFDQQGRKGCPLSVYSNIQGIEGRALDIRDQHTGKIVATVDKQWLDRPVLTLEGRPVTIEWQDGEALWVSAYTGEDVAERLIYRSAGQLLTYELARALPSVLGLPDGVAPLVPSPHGCTLFHWLGDVYGYALFDLLRYQVYAWETEEPGLCVELGDEPRALPAWTEEQVAQYCLDNYRALEPLLALGPCQHLLPSALRRRAVVAQFDVPRFLAAVGALQAKRAPEALAEDLIRLIGD